MNAWLANALCGFFSFVSAYTFLQWGVDRTHRPLIFAHLGLLGDLFELALIVGALAGLLSAGVWSHLHLSWYVFPVTTIGIAVLFVMLMRSLRFQAIATSALGPVVSLGVVVWVNWWMWFGSGPV